MSKTNNWFVYDFEILPNFICVVFYNPYTYTWEFAYDHGTEVTNTKALLNKFNKGDVTLIGYNNHAFDDILLAYITGTDTKLSNIYDLAQDIIVASNTRTLWGSDLIRYKPRTWFTSIDILQLFNPVDRVSLKKLAISMNAPIIEEMPVKHNHHVKQSEIKGLLQYCQYDVHDTSMAFVALFNEIELRFKIGPKYGVKNILSSCRSKLSKQLLAHMYEKQSGIPYNIFSKQKTTYDTIKFGDCIDSRVVFKSKNLNELLDEIKTQTFNMSDIKQIKYEKTVLIGNTKYTVATGGLHSEHTPTLYESKDGNLLWDWDFGSYYPNLMLNLLIYPKHLGQDFLKLLQIIVNQRLQAKADHDYTTSDTLKIVINAVYGLLKYTGPGGWFEDAMALYRVTLNGQLFILMIIEDLELNDIPIVYANTKPK